MDLVGIGKFVLDNGPVILNGVVGVFTGLIAIFMVIPGDQPEKALQGIVDFISKFSKK